MDEEQEAYTGITERLVYLERQNKQLRLAVGGTAVGLILTIIVMLVISRTGPLVRTHQLEIVDRSGNRRVVLRTLSNGAPSLVFYDAASKVRLSIGLSSEIEQKNSKPYALENPSLTLFDDQEIARLRLGTHISLPPPSPGEAQQMTGLALYDAFGTDRADIVVGADGTPKVRLRDKEEWVNTMLSVRPNGTPALTMYDLDKSLAEFGITSAGKPYLSLTTTWGRSRILTP